MKRTLAFQLDYTRIKSAFIVFLFFLSLLASDNSSAADVTVAWDPSTSANVGGYRLHYGTSTKNYTNNVDTAKATTYQVTGLTEGNTYYFAVKAYNATNTAESGFSNELSVAIPNTTDLTANFSASKISGSSPLLVSFSPTTTGTVNAWSWNFGDPAIPVSTSQNPTVTYSKPGTYTVSLTVSGVAGSTTATKVNYITVTEPKPLANFDATPKTGHAPLSVAFRDISTGIVNTRMWNFGDGATSTLANPSHTYSTPGLYTVSLTVAGTGGGTTKTIAGFINVTAPSTSVSSGQGPVAVYSFEENSGSIIIDSSGKGNHGTLKEAVRVQPGRYGKGLNFDGINDWITINDSPSLDFSAGYTLEAWVKPVGLGLSNVITKEQPAGAVYSLYSSENDDLPIGALNDGTAYRVVSGNTFLPINQWTHLIATYNGIYQRLYMNGVQIAVRAQAGLIKQSSGFLRIGGNSVWGEFFHGTLDDIKIYNRALSATEIARDFSTPGNISHPPRITVGRNTIYPTVDSNPPGSASAFKIIPAKNSVVTEIATYLDTTSTATELVAGIYNDNQGHPGSLLAKGKLSTLSPGVWNKVPIMTVKLVAAKPYWIAILGMKGELKFRDNLGTGTIPTETSVSTNLTTLPAGWMTGNIDYSKDGPVSSYAVGYTGP